MASLVTALFWTAFALSHFYLGFRFYSWVLHPLCQCPLWLVAVLLLFLGSAFQIGYNAHKLPLKLRRFLIGVGGHWAGALLPLLLGFVGLDALRFLFLHLGGIVFPPSWLLYASLGVLLVIGGVLAWGTRCAVSPRLTRYTVSVQKKAGPLSELRVALISDVHLGVSIDHEHLSVLCRRLNEMEADLILIAGDVLDAGLPRLHDADRIAAVFRTLNARYGVYACLGNHDVRGGATVEQTIEYLHSCGLHVLRDQAVRIGDAFTLIGRADYGFARHAGQPRAALAELMTKADPALPVLLLDHQPNQLHEAADAGVDVQFSGHTHNGQMFPISLLTRRQFETDFGLWTQGPFTAIVSAGYGTWGPRLRIGSRSEIVLATLTFDGETK